MGRPVLVLFLVLSACGGDTAAVDVGGTETDARGTDIQRVTVEKLEPCSIEKRSVAAGGLTERISFQYDADDRVIREEHDENGDGAVEWLVVHTYEDDEHPVVSEVDADADGEVDERTSYELNADGRVVRESLDRDLDGSPESVRTFRYNGAGEVLWMRFDSDANGEVDYWQDYIYNDEGQLLEERTFRTGVSGPEEVRAYEYDYKGLLVTKYETLKTLHHEKELETSYAYYDDGRVRTERVDVGADGKVEQTLRYTWTGDGEPLSVSMDKGDDGTVDQLTRYTYDEAGNLLRIEDDLDGDRVADESVVYGYSCWD